MTAQETAKYVATISRLGGRHLDLKTSGALGDQLADISAKYETYGTADQLAAELEARGVQATPGASRSCALAVDVGRQFDDEMTVTVGMGTVLAEPDTSTRGITTFGPVAREFIRRFDDFMYPNLVKKGEDE